jgi:hypothetical protein
MTMKAQEIVDSIGAGVANALATNRLFLGVEVDAFQNADIWPEYVMTVEVAKELTGPDRQVSLEVHMKELRRQARALAWLKQGGKASDQQQVVSKLAPFKFGKKDSQRLDILVRQSDALQPPLLMVEAKLGVRNLAGVKEDIDRVVRLFDMYEAVKLLTDQIIYGAVVFHSMEEGNNIGVAGVRAQELLKGVRAHLNSVKATRPWLNAEAGLPSQGTLIQPVTGYTEHYEDGASEDVFAKDCFHFAPGLVLVGNANDVVSVRF